MKRTLIEATAVGRKFSVCEKKILSGRRWSSTVNEVATKLGKSATFFSA